MPADDVTRAAQILSARTLADPGRRKAWERISNRILERLPEVRADHERAAESWRRLTGGEMPATGEEWTAAAIHYGIVAECVADGDFTRQAVLDAMTRTTLRHRDAAGVRGANHADAERKRKPRHSGDTARVVDSYPDELAKRIVKARSDYTRTQRDLRHTVVPQNQWLYDWCCENGINASKTFPAAFDGEDFCDRARRFWGAMRKRRSRRA